MASFSARFSRLLRAALLLGAANAAAQAVPRTVVVEHFTNTRCSICASRNPGFYANLRQQPPTLHVAYHPSSPYAACLFSTQNVVENDARTNYYGVYGSTPRLVINGTVVPAGQNYADPALFNPHRGQTSPFAVTAALQPQGADSLRVTVQVTTVAAHAYAGLSLYVPLVEDTVTYAAPNGEPRHFDVFRKSFTGPAPLAFVPGAALGSVVTINRTIGRAAGWAGTRLYALALVQDAGRAVVQAAASPRLGTVITGRADETAAPDLVAYPNPAETTLYLPGGQQLRQLTIHDGTGRLVCAQPIGADQLAVGELPPGLYLLRAFGPDGRRRTLRFVR